VTRQLGTLARLCLLAALVLPALAFAPHAEHAFWAAEALATRFLAPMAFLLALACWQLSSKSETKQNLGQGRVLGLLWISLWILSALFSRRWDLSLQELSLWLAYPMIFAAAWWLGESPETRAKLLAVLLSVGALEALYALLQISGKDPMPWSTNFGGRAGAFLGNPNFLGGHLALLFPLSLTLSLKRGSWRWALCALLLASLLASQTRGAWIGAALGSALGLFVLAKGDSGILKRHRRALLAMAGLAALALGSLLWMKPQNLERLGSGEEVARRSVLAEATASLALQHPLLGLSPGLFRIDFPSAQSTGLDSSSYASRGYIVSEHAHNDLLQMAADCGLPAALLYAAILIWLFTKLSQGRQTAVRAGILGGLAALSLHGLANFPFLIAPTQMTAWAMAALGLREVLPVGKGPEPKQRFRFFWPSWSAGLLLFAASAVFAGRLFAQDLLWWIGQGELNLKHPVQASAWLERSLKLNEEEDRIWSSLGQAQALQNQNLAAASSLEEAVQLNEHDAQSRLAWSRSLMNLKRYPEAEAALAPALQDAPNFPELYEPYAASLFMQRKFEKAIHVYDLGLAISPSASLLGNKAAALANMGHYGEAQQSLSQALAMEPQNPQLLQLKKALP
jgi:tetratricopeptide (TPR) repeat protein